MPSIRHATEADAEPILDLRCAAIRVFGVERYHEEQVERWAAQPLGSAPYVESIRSETESVLVAEVSGELAGFGRVEPDTGVVSAVYVHPDHARNRVGSELLSHLESRARNAGVDSVTLHASLNAVPFYEARGYERISTVIHEVTGGGELACVEMARNISVA
ncbi:GNAT family N-acetyltransferase [Haladaptatus sp. DYF46]|uniref:GNAT family N-acetyltransferase n=1 Tax=Haladaptatus sp. DYF46 TaxID=2886041 RepID=UPI001E4247B4|nr:GNAT family N-acetyltransferase [Haladaptatus sp. DYF46]